MDHLVLNQSNQNIRFQFCHFHQSQTRVHLKRMLRILVELISFDQWAPNHFYGARGHKSLSDMSEIGSSSVRPSGKWRHGWRFQQHQRRRGIGLAVRVQANGKIKGRKSKFNYFWYSPWIYLRKQPSNQLYFGHNQLVDMRFHRSHKDPKMIKTIKFSLTGWFNHSRSLNFIYSELTFPVVNPRAKYLASDRDDSSLHPS